ncbi:MAG: hypothetical protein ACK56F_08240, partial [bacterium]
SALGANRLRPVPDDSPATQDVSSEIPHGDLSVVPTGGPGDAGAFPEHVPEIPGSAHRGTQQVLARYSARPGKSVACQLEVLP